MSDKTKTRQMEKSPISIPFMVETFINCGSEVLHEAMREGKSGVHCSTLFNAIQFTHTAQNELKNGKVPVSIADSVVDVFMDGLAAMEALGAFVA